MFALRYFNPRYWAERYWPKVGEDQVVITTICVLPEIELRIPADLALALAVPQEATIDLAIPSLPTLALEC